MDFKEAASRSIENITKFGDTDIFPFPAERTWFAERRSDAVNLLEEFHKNFEEQMAQQPPQTIDCLVPVGYAGFRWATQIEPVWNAYYLSLVLQLAEDIENARIPRDERIVFSYRYCDDRSEPKLFEDVTWHDYRLNSLQESRKHKYVVVTDIADFYPRIYHHRLENALLRLSGGGDTHSRIMKLLQAFSQNVSYGLPVGGPASRLLSELCLNSADFHLWRNKIKFCRYADDYSIFCDSEAEAYRILVALSECLMNEGLTLQKKKTRILTAGEFQETSAFLDPDAIDSDVKTVNRNIRGGDLRQLIVYFALQNASGVAKWDYGCFLNPRIGVSYSFSVESLLRQISGGRTASDALRSLVEEFAERSIVLDSTF